MLSRIRHPFKGKKANIKEQEPSLLSKLLVGDLNVSGHIEIEVPRATDRVIHIDIKTVERGRTVTTVSEPVVKDAFISVEMTDILNWGKRVTRDPRLTYPEALKEARRAYEELTDDNEFIRRIRTDLAKMEQFAEDAKSKSGSIQVTT